MPFENGDLILLSPVASDYKTNYEKSRWWLRENPHVQLVAEDDVLEVYLWAGQ